MSNPLMFPSSGDFFLRNVSGKILMSTKIPYFSLILFFSENCQHCMNFIPIFKQLPKQIQTCRFGMVNIKNEMNVVRMSQQSSYPIKYVPLILLYQDGVPSANYTGPASLRDLAMFVVETADYIVKRNRDDVERNNQMRRQQNYNQQQQHNQQQQGGGDYGYVQDTKNHNIAYPGRADTEFSPAPLYGDKIPEKVSWLSADEAFRNAEHFLQQQNMYNGRGDGTMKYTIHN